jgi:Glycosyl transferase family 21
MLIEKLDRIQYTRNSSRGKRSIFNRRNTYSFFVSIIDFSLIDIQGSLHCISQTGSTRVLSSYIYLSILAFQKSTLDGESLENTTSITIPVNDIKNPKIFNMLPAYESAQYPLLLISDSGIIMSNNTLYDMTVCMDDTVGLVHQVPFTYDQKGFVASVEKVRRI